MTCAENPRLQAYFDDELDTAGTAAMQRHLAQCAVCQQALKELQLLRRTVRALSPAGPAPALRRSIALALQEAGRERESLAVRWQRLWQARTFWFGALGGAAAGIAGALLLLWWLPLASENSLLTQIASAHVQSLSGGPLLQVESSDHHTVKPWFSGRSDVSPVVADFTPQGYALLGGRSARLGAQRAAVLVYRHGAHVIDVYSWAAQGAPSMTERTLRGYHLLLWQVDDVRYCAIADSAWPELHKLALLLQQRARLESRGTAG